MKFKGIILSIFLLFITLVFFIVKGNFFKYNDINSFIEEPSSHNLQIEGKWILEDVKNFGNSDKNFQEEDFKYVYISKNFVSFGKYYTEFPKFKFRYLNLDKYLTSNGILETNLNTESNEKIIVTVDDGDFFYQEFIKISEDKIALIFDKNYLTYKLESKTFDRENVDKEKNQLKIGKNTSLDSMDTTLLLGLKNKDDLKYTTLIFRKEYENNIIVKKLNGIFVNKNNSFFLVDNILDENGEQKGIYITKDYLRVDENRFLKTTGILNYVGENYISLEIVDKNSGQKKYELYSNENFNKDSKISIVQLSGEAGKISYYDSLRKIKEYSLDNFFEDVDNIGVYRKNYNWNFKSVFNNNFNSKLTSTEFDLDIIPLLPVFELTTNKISNNIIKNKIPDFIDYFISPNENLICILNHNNFYIYEIENKQISTNPISIVEIPKNSEIIMSQWEMNENSNSTFKEISKISTENINYR